jgi:hypothetical protein
VIAARRGQVFIREINHNPAMQNSASGDQAAITAGN